MVAASTKSAAADAAPSATAEMSIARTEGFIDPQRPVQANPLRNCQARELNEVGSPFGRVVGIRRRVKLLRGGTLGQVFPRPKEVRPEHFGRLFGVERSHHAYHRHVQPGPSNACDGRRVGDAREASQQDMLLHPSGTIDVVPQVQKAKSLGERPRFVPKLGEPFQHVGHVVGSQ
eukprot:scaffold965_cov262-Pinguiococcus_pyrenoidosus.AAC.9